MNQFSQFAALPAAAMLLSGTLFSQVTRRYEVVALQGEAAPSTGPTATYGIFGVDPRI
ncbi:MAG: hypothetical protein OSB65_10900 [Roseibacillus sp.]|jgi:hypothetical protein|nr:hypothetical protein [Roseibacillus sp.]|tara:strand:+ start:338 stop:511 length:174 start_codon:yes stop_codon:yes gene_type:complete